MGCEPGVVRGRPCDLPGCAASTYPSVSRVRRLPSRSRREGRAVRFIGMDIHRDFCEVAISEDGKLRSAGRIQASVEQLELFAPSLAADDVVALEATGGAGLVVDLLEPHVAAVLVANTRKLAQLSRAKAKT